MNFTIDELALAIQCPTCHAVGWCETKSGVRAKNLHAARVDPVRHAWAAGYLSGEADTVRSVPALRSRKVAS